MPAPITIPTPGAETVDTIAAEIPPTSPSIPKNTPWAAICPKLK